MCAQGQVPVQPSSGPGPQLAPCASCLLPGGHPAHGSLGLSIAPACPGSGQVSRDADSPVGLPVPAHPHTPCSSSSLPVQISLPSTMRMTTSDGTQYLAKQMHFHWGGASSEISGSEHTVDGMRYVIEVPSGSSFFQTP